MLFRSERIDEYGNSLGVISDHVGISSASTWRRLLQFLRNASIFNFTYGLMRTGVLRRTRLYGLYPMSDRVLFAEMAMCGELLEVREPLYRLRLHSGRSLQMHATAQARRELFDPSCAGKRHLLPIAWRVYVELVSGAWRTPPRLPEKVACVAVALVVPPWLSFRNFGGRWKRRLLSGVRRSLRFG